LADTRGVRLALAGDTMLGRRVGQELGRRPPKPLFAPELATLVGEADLAVVNLECCIAESGTPAPKTFTFRAPPVAAEVLAELGVDCVTLANNHALDYGEEALLETFQHLRAAEIAWVGAGENIARARAPIVLAAGGFRLGVVAITDHPREFAATPERPGVAYGEGAPRWVLDAAASLDVDATLVSPHWGPNMATEPLPRVRAAAQAFVEAGAALVAGHSAHVFHGVEGPVLYDLGDFVDDYRVDPVLRNDLGLLFLVDFERTWPVRLEAVPLKLDFCFTRLARGADAGWVRERFRGASAALGTAVREEGERLVVSFRSDGS
jgi:poly-gamma-glutamate capsule biosynthesis protein CapA/YwtB (metallophosphatase superfamily)